MKKILTIAGSDTSGGAGIQADLRTFAKYDLYGMCALTVIVTMNPKDWSHDVFPIPVPVIEKELETAFDSVGVDALKTGMLPTVEIIEIVADKIKDYCGKIPLVIDPVMVCKGSKPLFPDHAQALATKLIKYATVTTANLFEAAQLAGMEPFEKFNDAKKAAEKIVKAGSKNVIIKAAGHLQDKESSGDLLFDGKEFFIAEGPRINTTHTHGLGCTFAAHIAAQLCLGNDLKSACLATKEKITKGLIHNFALSKFAGTLDFSKSFE